MIGMLTAQRLVERSLAEYRPRIAVVDGERSLTYAQLGDRTARLANVLLASGASAERPAAVLLPNGAAIIELDLACTRAGVTRVGIGSRLSAEEAQYILSHAQASVLVTDRANMERIDGEALAGLSAVLLVDEDAAAPASGGVQGYEAALAAASAELRAPSVAPEHPAYILYTSGTTGRPKGATHSHGGRVAALVNMLASEIAADSRSAMVHCAPLTHGSGSKVLTFLALGARNVVLPRFEPELFARTIVEQGGTHSFMVPTMLQMLLDGGPKVTDAVRRMTQISFGGAPITNALFGRSVEGFGPILTQVFGSCEAPHPITVLRPDGYAECDAPGALGATAGRASAGSDIKIVGEEGQALAAGEEGELLVRGSHLMSGYWRDPAASAEVLDENGWYATGDIALVDDKGFVYFRDRKRDLIISGGLNVYPSEVERVMAEHPQVKEVAVIGCPDDRWGEAVVACIVAVPGAEPEEAQLIAWVGEHLAGYKKPKRVVFFRELPKGSTNKVLKRELRAQFWSGRERRIN